jgi:multiple sugar transport system substrate-binding protein
MLQGTTAPVSRRQLLHTAGSAALAVGIGASIIIPGRASAQQKTLKILQWNHFVPGYDKWFNDTYVKEWGAKHNTNVMVDNIGLAEINSRAVAEVSAQKGHDLCLFLSPPTVHEEGCE